jgi:hypothetical protein
VIEAIVIRKEDPLVYSTGVVVEPTIVPELDESDGLPNRDPEEVDVAVKGAVPDMIGSTVTQRQRGITESIASQQLH